MERVSLATNPADHIGTTAGTMQAFRLAGVPVRFHFTFLLFAIYLVVTTLGGAFSASFGLFILGLFASVLLHELAHAGVASKLGIRTLEIVMFPIGGVSRLERRVTPGEELAISIAGPLANLLLSAAIFGYLITTRVPIEMTPVNLLEPTNANVVQRLAFANLLLAGFNLLPAFPMDGGRMLRALLSLVRPENEATRTAAWMGRALAISMGLYGLLFGHLLLAFFAFFVWMGAAQEATAALGRGLTAGIPVRAAMRTEFHCLNHGATVGEAVSLLLATAQQDFPVLHGEEVIGLLDHQRLMRALAAEGPESFVAGVMDREYLAIDPESELSQNLALMARAGRCALVMEEGNLVGLLTSENLSEFLLLRRFGLEPVV